MEQAMAQQHQEGRNRHGSDLSWLAMLIESYERVSSCDFRAMPCEAAILKAVRDQLERPVSARTPSHSGLLN